jgi:TonB family protein
MSRRHITIASLGLFFIASTHAVLAGQSSDAEKYLQNQLLGQKLILRNFYTDKHLEYDSNGSLIKGGTIGPWNKAQFLVEKVQIKGEKLLIQGHRIETEYDRKYDEIVSHATLDTIEIIIQLNPNAISETDLTHLFLKVFLTKQDHLEELVPEPWKTILTLHKVTDEKPLPIVHKLDPGVSPPKAIRMPGPEYTDEARKAGIQGTVVLSLIVDVDGKPKNVTVIKPLWHGLNDQAVEAVRSWRFTPAKKDGQPVPVQVNVEVSFYLSN